MDDITKNVFCPSCGRNTAFIERAYRSDEGSYRQFIKHELCGYRVPLFQYITRLFKSNGIEIVLKSQRIEVHNLDFECENESFGKTLNQLLSQTNGFFSGVSIKLNTVLSNLVCPICDSTEFTSQRNDIYCKNEHFHISGKNFFLSSITSPYSAQEAVNAAEEDTFIINSSRTEDISNNEGSIQQLVFNEVAEVVYRHNDFTNKNVLVLNPKGSSNPNDYADFLVYLNTKHGTLFTIIEKVKHLG